MIQPGAERASPAPAAVEPAPAATLILVRDAPVRDDSVRDDSGDPETLLQVLMVERNAAAAFGPGALVFPGGRLDPGDQDPGWERLALGWRDLDPEARALRLCAVRETFEETALLLAHGATTEPADSERRRGDRSLAPDMAQARGALCAGAMGFQALVEGLGLRLDLGALIPFARWITPEDRPIRFDAAFFIAPAPADQSAVADGGETLNAEWIEPGRALQLAAVGQRRLMFPTRATLERLARSRSAADAVAAARATDAVTFRPRPGDAPRL